MRRISMLLVTMLVLGAFALPALASTSATLPDATPVSAEDEGGKKVDEALQEQLVYGAPEKKQVVDAAGVKKELAAVAAEASPVPVIITFGMFGLVILTIGGGVAVYRKA